MRVQGISVWIEAGGCSEPHGDLSETVLLIFNSSTENQRAKQNNITPQLQKPIIKKI